MENLLPFKNPPSIAVIGDVCLDLYYFTGKEGAEISAETGLQSFSVYDSRLDLGAAGNAAANCKTLGAKNVDIYGIAGNDIWSGMLFNLLDKSGINRNGVFVQKKNWQTHVFHKIIQDKSELPRYDMGNLNIPYEKTIDNILSLFESCIGQYQCVIINEQVPFGIHSVYFQKKLLALIEKYNASDKLLWFSDCRKLNDVYNHTIRKLNINEAGKIINSDQTAPLIAEQLYKRWKTPVILTLGEEGALVFDKDKSTQINSLHFNSEIDIVGAGDAFLAGLVCAMGAGIPIYESALIGTFSAGVSLTKIYETGHPEISEVIELASDAELNYNFSLSNDENSARYFEDTEIEICNDFKTQKGFPQTAIFDHDGTISVLRQGWEDVMQNIMFNAVCGKITKFGKNILLKDHSAIEKIHSAVSSLIEKTTGIQTLMQMYLLRELVISFGFVTQEEVLSPEEYKAIYIKALFAAMEKRLAAVKEGKLTAADLTIKASVSFLEKLHSAGTKLYLASGTDEEDVKKEAELLGYASLFNGGIYGSVGDIKNDPKKLVIRKIISGLDSSGAGRIVVFGDGPVEMREAKKAGILAVGLLSDERRRWGINKDKRKRLVLGGADILIPDFSCQNELCRLCGWN